MGRVFRLASTSSMTHSSIPQPSGPLHHHPAERLRLINLMRWATLASLVGLIALGLLWELKWAPLPGGTGMLALKVVPLCFGITGLLKHRLYTFRWLSLLVWLYVTEGLMRVTSDTGLSQWLAGVEVALSCLLFIGCSVYVRLRLKGKPPQAPIPG